MCWPKSLWYAEGRLSRRWRCAAGLCRVLLTWSHRPDRVAGTAGGGVWTAVLTVLTSIARLGYARHSQVLVQPDPLPASRGISEGFSLV